MEAKLCDQVMGELIFGGPLETYVTIDQAVEPSDTPEHGDDKTNVLVAMTGIQGTCGQTP